ncbi:catechol dioxygenase [Paecilomyces variotii No. 5]|uniref:Catechol dioxygenase n=1 Tax=Byssochlamys spectabilis (strain No. 5 / NBRC 109023) TaxID=1356009 RepID=V5FTH8_BYSSN|nr:catechol dioxygenase [Paecilomyces variotii No. 5]
MAPAELEDLLADNLTPHVIKTSTQNVKDARIKELISKLIQHLHDYTREVQLKPHEWEAAIQYLTNIGQESSRDRQEMILLSDVIGVSALVDTITSAQAKADLATESSVLGPFHSPDAQVLDNGQCIGSPGTVGELTLIHGTVRSVDGKPIKGVSVDIWETNGNGFYDMQDPNRSGPDCRGIFPTDDEGRYYLIGIKSVDYDIPSDGSVGILLGLLNRNVTRPAHVHFQLKHPSYIDLTTALYSATSAHIASDPVFGVKKPLVKHFEWMNDPTALVKEYNLEKSLQQVAWDGKGLWILHHDFVMLQKEIENAGVLEILQQQNDKLDTMLDHISNIEKNRHHSHSHSKANAASWVEDPLPLFQSSTSGFFCIRVMDINLRANEYATPEPDVLNESEPTTPLLSFSILHGQTVDEVTQDMVDEFGMDNFTTHHSNATSDSTRNPSIQPLDHLEGNEIIRLLHVYEDLAGMMYPIVNVEDMEGRVNEIWISNAAKNMNTGKSDQLRRKDVAMLEMVVNIALVIETEDGSDLIQSLHDDLWPQVESMIWHTKVDLQGLVLLTLMGVYYFYSNKWRVAWRLLGNVARIILELGLNREIVLSRSFPNQRQHAQVVNTIWSIFVLEQQLSYSLGLSVATNDLRLDASFPGPIEAPYLTAMIQYARIGAHTCDSLQGEKNTGQTISGNGQDVFSYFQFRLEEWRKNIKTEFQFKASDERTEKWNRMLSKILHLRANHLQIVVSRLLLFENGVAGTSPIDIWTPCVDVAADTAHVLTNMDGSPLTCAFKKSRSNYFLIAALGMSLLAISQNSPPPASPSPNAKTVMSPTTYLKAQQTARICLNLLYSRAHSSRQSRWLWKRVQGLAARLNVLDFLGPTDTLNDNNRAYTIPMQDINEAYINNAGPLENRELTDADPALDMHFSTSVELGQESGAAIDMISGLDMMLDPAVIASGFGQ